MQDYPSGTITFLFSDIEGSTYLWETYPEQMRTALAQHDTLISEAVTRHQGTDVRKRGEGDSHFAVFEDAKLAAACAIDIQRGLAGQQHPELGSIKVRIAIHTGHAEYRDEDYYGPSLNRCARMRSAAHGGQILVSEDTKQLIESGLPTGAALQNLGLHRLKDLLEPARIYQLNGEGLRTDFPEIRSLSAAKHNLPIQLTSFVGRETQIEAIHELLTHKRLITLTGAGGSGKTRLSQHIAAEIIDDFVDGVWFVPLVSVREAGHIAQKVSESLPISLGGRDPISAIIEEYQNGAALIVLDNCEHVIKEAAVLVHRLLTDCPKLSFLATSREPLAVRGEHLYLVPTLECRVRNAGVSVESLGELEAVRLLQDRAASKLSGENILNAGSAPAIAALCARLEGIPLAIEQAASNMSTLSPAQVLQRIEKHFAMLPIEEEGTDERHRTIQATISWSYDSLTEQERSLFQCLSYFVGGCSLEAAEHLCADELFDESETLIWMDRLVKRSLVLAESSDYGDRRYRMLEPIREFAERLRNSTDETKCRSKHLAWYRKLASDSYEFGLDSDDARYFKIVAADHDNIRSALEWALGHQDFSIDAVEICVSMYRFWMRTGHIREGAAWTLRAIEAQRDAPEELVATALNFLGIMTWQSGDLENAATWLSKSREKWNHLGDEQKVASVQSNLASIAFLSGDFAIAVELYSEAERTFREAGDLLRLAHTLENLGVSHSKGGNLDAAISCLEEAVDIHRAQGKRGELAKALDSYIGIYDLQGRLLDAAGLLVEACELGLQSNDYFVIANLLEVGVRMCLELEEPRLASKAFGSMNFAFERSERLPAPGEKERRETLAGRLVEALGKEDYRRALREGRALGPEVMLQHVHARLQQVIEASEPELA